jgi:type IV secretion system protein TrbE
LGSLPAHGRYNVRRPIVAHRAFVDLAPTTAIWSGHPRNPALPGQGPCLVAATRGSTPFFWSLAAGDVQHALVAGPTGSGKSVLVNTVIAQYLRYPGAQVISLDRGWSQYVLCRAAGGCHYAPAAERPDGDRFAPLAHVDDPNELPHAADWVEDLLQLQGIQVDPARRAAITRALELLAGSRQRTLSTFAAKIQDTALREALAPYVEGGAFGHLFAATRSPLRQGALHVVEMEALLPLRHKVLTPLVTHLFREIERRLDGRPTLLVVEEATQLLADSLFAQRLRNWLLELRKKNAGVVFVGQTLGSFLGTQLADALLENCPTRVFLPNGAARDPRTADDYRAFGLNERQIDLVARATPKRDYYVDTPDGSRMIQLDLSPGALALLAAAGPRARQEADRLAAAGGAAWPERYLRDLGHDHLADLVAAPAPPAEPPHPGDRRTVARPTDPRPEETHHAPA